MKARVLLNDFRAQWRDIRAEALEAVDRVGESGSLILGSNVTRFEEALASQSGVRHAIGCSNGMDAIEISLRVLKLEPGERVITTPLSAFATSLAVIRAGGVPVFLDTDESGLLDLVALEKLLSESNPRPRFLLPVHLFGHALDLRKLAEIKKRFDLYLVEDCAQAILATSHGLPIGTMGDLSAVSLYPTKNLGCLGDGGVILTDSHDFATIAKALRNYGQTKKYLHAYIGMNSRLDELHAAILMDALLPRLPRVTERRRAIAATYREKILSPQLVIPPEPHSSKSVYHLFPILVRQDRDAFQRFLSSQGVDSSVHYPILIPDQPAMTGQDFEVNGALLNARRFAEGEVSLPMHPYLTDEEVARVIDACNSWRS